MINFERNVFINNIINSKEFKENDKISAIIHETRKLFSEDMETEECYNYLLELDERIFLIINLMNYTYQVNNGGHQQYFDNGYASFETIGKGFFSKKSDNIDLFEEMHSLFKKYFEKNEITIKFDNIMNYFASHIDHESCDNCDGIGYFSGEQTEENCSNCDGCGYVDVDGEKEECPECNGMGYFINEEDDEQCSECSGKGYYNDFSFTGDGTIDNAFYELSNEWEKLINSLCNDIINNECSMSKVYDWNDKKISNKKPKVKLVGTDGNAFSLIGKCCEAMRVAKISKEVIEEFKKEVLSSDYNNVLVTCCKYCEVC